MLQYPTCNVTVYTIHYILMLPQVTHIVTVVTLPVGRLMLGVTMSDIVVTNMFLWQRCPTAETFRFLELPLSAVLVCAREPYIRTRAKL
jgi:hypothetical protein